MEYQQRKLKASDKAMPPVCPLHDRLLEYSRSDVYPFHMPGHKRQLQPFSELYQIDITEIDGFDNLHHAEGILLEAQQRAAELYRADETFFLINGSTCGILAAVSAAVCRGGQLLMARNCHKAAYHAVLLNDLHVSYVYPEADMARGIHCAVTVEAVQDAFREHPQAEAFLLTSPTYDGVVSDVRAIAKVVHQAGAVLIVDEAHGAHFGMHPYFPEHALACRADLVINSVHKTLPAPTQTALLHVQGTRVNRERLRRYLAVYQTSSPSYVLLSGIDACVSMLRQYGQELFAQFAVRLEGLRAALSQMRALHLVTGQEKELACFDFDRSKILISTEQCGISGAALSQLLRSRYHLEMEMEAEHYVTAITTVADTEEGLDRLQAALLELDDALADAGQKCGPEAVAGVQEQKDEPGSVRWYRSEAVLTLTQADEAEKERIPLMDSAGRISGEFVYLYPPGIPLLVPGERITWPLLQQLEQYRRAGLRLQGLADYGAGELLAVREQTEEQQEKESGKTAGDGWNIKAE